MILQDGTYQLVDSEFVKLNLKAGYYVADKGHETILNANVGTEIIDATIEYYRLLCLREDKFLGVWTQGNQVFFDVSEFYINFQDAIDAGRANEQVAIWDITNSIAIKIASVPFVSRYFNTTGISSISQRTADTCAILAHRRARQETLTPFEVSVLKGEA